MGDVRARTRPDARVGAQADGTLGESLRTPRWGVRPADEAASGGVDAAVPHALVCKGPLTSDSATSPITPAGVGREGVQGAEELAEVVLSEGQEDAHLTLSAHD